MSSVSPPAWLAKIIAEMVGTYALVFMGCGAIAINHSTDGALGHLGICAVFGLVITSMIYATGHLSGAHFNPAVTIAFASVGRFPLKEVPGYIIGQSIAAILAAASLWWCLEAPDIIGTTTPAGTWVQSFTLEVVLTFFLMFVIIAVATDSRAVGSQAGLAIGCTVALCALMGGPISGASMNPARTLGPALMGGEWSGFWIYIFAPIIGAILAAFLYQFIRCEEGGTDAKGCC